MKSEIVCISDTQIYSNYENFFFRLTFLYVCNPNFLFVNQTLLCFVCNLDTCLDFRQLLCLKTEHTKVWISDKFGFQTFGLQTFTVIKTKN